jgi:hypothetical protein
MTVNSEDTRGYRRLPPAELESLITKIRRSAVNRHLSPQEWRWVDGMRKRLALLKKNGSN